MSQYETSLETAVGGANELTDVQLKDLCVWYEIYLGDIDDGLFERSEVEFRVWLDKELKSYQNSVES